MVELQLAYEDNIKVKNNSVSYSLQFLYLRIQKQRINNIKYGNELQLTKLFILMNKSSLSLTSTLSILKSLLLPNAITLMVFSQWQLAADLMDGFNSVGVSLNYRFFNLYMQHMAKRGENSSLFGLRSGPSWLSSR